jgi:hypothetical protein
VFEHDLFGKPVPTFPDHAVAIDDAAAIRNTRRNLKRNGLVNRHFALDACLSMIFSENRFPLFGIML